MYITKKTIFCLAPLFNLQRYRLLEDSNLNMKPSYRCKVYRIWSTYSLRV